MMIEQQQPQPHDQQQQIINSIMIANCNKYFGHHLSHHVPAATKNISANNNSSVKNIMSNSVVSGATNSVAAAPPPPLNNKANGMSSSSVGASQVAGVGSGGSSGGISGQPPPAITSKMGSRRIFSPQFKLQVLDSYRNDSDCKGNQRATARKYGIHRRQIQKWLQCEPALRATVLNNSSSGTAPSSGNHSHHHHANCKVDSNNNQNGGGHSHQKRALAKAAAAASESYLSLDRARHSDAPNAAINATTPSSVVQQQNSMEFFSPPAPPPSHALPSTSLINTNGVSSNKLADRSKIEMNEAVPIKPEFCFNTAAPHSSSATAASSSLTSFISTIYGNLAFPTPRLPQAAAAFGFDFPLPVAPIDLSMGHAERRPSTTDPDQQPPHRVSPYIHLEDARVPSRGVAAAEDLKFRRTAAAALPSSPIDLSCGKRKAADAGPEPAKPPKLFKPYLLDDQEEDFKVVVDDDDDLSPSGAASTKEEAFLDQEIAGLKDKYSRRFEYHPAAIWPAHHQYYPGSSPVYDAYYFGHENLTLYPTHYRYESHSSLSPSAASSPGHHPSRPASLFDSSMSSSTETGYGSWHSTSSPSSEVRSSPPMFSLDLKLQAVPPGTWTATASGISSSSSMSEQELRPHIGTVF